MANINNYRTALLSYRTPEQWRSIVIDGREFRGGRFNLEGRTVSGTELVETYKTDFPDKEDYSNRGHLDRLLHDCQIEKFDFSKPENIRGFLMSAKSEEEWKDWELSVHDFSSMQFQYQGVAKKGQKLAIDIFIDETNKQDGTYYSFMDYESKRELRKKLAEPDSVGFVQKILDAAGIEIRYKDIRTTDLTQEEVKKLLLSCAPEEKWKNWIFNSNEFNAIKFNPRPYKSFSGKLLLQTLRKTKSGLDIDGIFSDAGIMTGRTNPELAREARVVKYNEEYSFFDDNEKVREVILQLYSPEEWEKPKDFLAIRSKKVDIGDKRLSVHTLLQMYSVHEHNQEQERETGTNPYFTFSEMQHKDLQGVPTSNSNLMKELLEKAGIDHSKTFEPSITDFELRNPEVLRKFLTNGYYQGVPVDVRRLVDERGIMSVRNTTFRDSETGAEIKGHALMLYYTIEGLKEKHPEMSPKKLYNCGKSNKSVMLEMITLARL